MLAGAEDRQLRVAPRLSTTREASARRALQVRRRASTGCTPAARRNTLTFDETVRLLLVRSGLRCSAVAFGSSRGAGWLSCGRWIGSRKVAYFGLDSRERRRILALSGFDAFANPSGDGAHVLAA